MTTNLPCLLDILTMVRWLYLYPNIFICLLFSSVVCGKPILTHVPCQPLLVNAMLVARLHQNQWKDGCGLCLSVHNYL